MVRQTDIWMLTNSITQFNRGSESVMLYHTPSRSDVQGYCSPPIPALPAVHSYRDELENTAQEFMLANTQLVLAARRKIPRLADMQQLSCGDMFPG